MSQRATYGLPLTVVAILALIATACGCTLTATGTSNSSSGRAGEATGGQGGMGGTGYGGAGGMGSGDTSVGGSVAGSGGASAMVPVRALPGLTSITFYERTGGVAPTPYTFGVDSPELGTRLADPLAPDNRDFFGTSIESFDVYYSDGDGSFDLDGSYVTVTCVFGDSVAAGGGLNLAEIGLNYADERLEYGNYVASYVVLGDNAVERDVPKCVDSNVQTHTTMGNTAGAMDRLRLTVGFRSTSGERE